MLDGKKSIAWLTIFYDSSEIVGKKMKDADKSPLKSGNSSGEHHTPSRSEIEAYRRCDVPGSYGGSSEQDFYLRKLSHSRKARRQDDGRQAFSRDTGCLQPAGRSLQAYEGCTAWPRPTRHSHTLDSNTDRTDGNQRFKIYCNIGIMAHIDAGKTTTSERILLHGKPNKIGVKRTKALPSGGSMVQEQGARHHDHSRLQRPLSELHGQPVPDQPDRHPGTRRLHGRGGSVSLRVLTVLSPRSAVGGVEPQSETVWRQADKYNVPRLLRTIRWTARALLTSCRVRKPDQGALRFT